MKKCFFAHTIAYATFNAAILVLDLVTDPAVMEFYWPLGGWGAGLVNHYYFGLQG